MAGMGLEVEVEGLCFHPYYRSLIECGDGKRKETQGPTSHGLYFFKERPSESREPAANMEREMKQPWVYTRFLS